MSNADPGEIVTASSDGVTVEKSFEPDDFPVPAIAFVVRSEREETVSVRLVDSVPNYVPPEDIGFHPKYGAEFWDVEGDSIVFERDFEAGEEYTTVYGLRGSDADDVAEFLSEPRLESVDPPLEEADAGQTVRSVIGEDDPDADADARDVDEGDDVDVDVDVDEDDIASAIQEVDAESADDAVDAPEGGAGDDALDTSVDLSGPEVDDADGSSGRGSLASDLAAEVRSGEADEEAIAELREALGVDPASASVEARIEHLQSSVSDLEAYADAFEEFLDENGDAQRIIRETREEFEAATERLDEVEATADSAAETAETVDDRLEAQFEEFESRVETELDDVESRVDDALGEVDETLAGVDEAVEDRVEAELEDLWTAVDEAAADAADVSEELDSLREEVDETVDERVAELEADVEDLTDELEGLAEMRDRLASALGGIARSEDPDDGDSDDPDDDGAAADESTA